MKRRIATVMLLVGALGGVAIAATGLLTTSSPLGPETVARVNGTDISRRQFQSYLAAINANSKTPKETKEILDRLVDEELLVQRGVELGMLELNSTVRNAMVQAVTRRFSADDGQPVPDDTLEAWYRQNLGYFTPANRYRVRLIEPDIALPDKPMTAQSLTAYLGPAVTARIESLSPGDTTEVVSGNTRFRLTLLEREAGEAPAFENVKPMALREYRRAQSEKAFDDYLAWLRERADITIGDLK